MENDADPFDRIDFIEIGRATSIVSGFVACLFSAQFLLNVGLIINWLFYKADFCAQFGPVYQYFHLPMTNAGGLGGTPFFCRFEIVARVSFLICMIAYHFIPLSLVFDNIRFGFVKNLQIQCLFLLLSAFGLCLVFMGNADAGDVEANGWGVHWALIWPIFTAFFALLSWGLCFGRGRIFIKEGVK